MIFSLDTIRKWRNKVLAKISLPEVPIYWIDFSSFSGFSPKKKNSSQRFPFFQEKCILGHSGGERAFSSKVPSLFAGLVYHVNNFNMQELCDEISPPPIRWKPIDRKSSFIRFPRKQPFTISFKLCLAIFQIQFFLPETLTFY